MFKGSLQSIEIPWDMKGKDTSLSNAAHEILEKAKELQELSKAFKDMTGVGVTGVTKSDVTGISIDDKRVTINL